MWLGWLGECGRAKGGRSDFLVRTHAWAAGMRERQPLLASLSHLRFLPLRPGETLPVVCSCAFREIFKSEIAFLYKAPPNCISERPPRT